MNETESLKSEIERLKKENDYLKGLLTKAGICFETETIVDKAGAYDPGQGSRIIPKTDFSEEDANQFFKMFWGRTDVYSRRTVVKSKGTANYYPQCYKFWKEGCPKKTDKRKQCSDCASPAYIPLEARQIIAHLKGQSKEAEDVIGVYPLFPDDTCRFIVFDFDNHEEGADKYDYANTDDAWKDEVNALREICMKIIVVTWKPDMYGFGDSVYWMELQERMRNAGFEVNLVEDYCTHYCIIDRELVWYGSMNFLGKEDAEDNLMRVLDKGIAAELLGMTFGSDKHWGERMN